MRPSKGRDRPNKRHSPSPIRESVRSRHLDDSGADPRWPGDADDDKDGQDGHDGKKHPVHNPSFEVPGQSASQAGNQRTSQIPIAVKQNEAGNNGRGFPTPNPRIIVLPAEAISAKALEQFLKDKFRGRATVIVEPGRGDIESTVFIKEDYELTPEDLRSVVELSCRSLDRYTVKWLVGEYSDKQRQSSGNGFEVTLRGMRVEPQVKYVLKPSYPTSSSKAGGRHDDTWY